MPDLASIIREAADRYRISPQLMLRIAQIESGMNPNASSSTSSARGVYQFLTKPGGSWSKYGNGGNPLDPYANVDAGARYIKDNQAALRAKLGREPADWETYFAHQQGPAGAPALLMNPNRPAAEVLQAFYKDPATARKAISGNAGNPDATAQDFANLWKAKYEGTAVPGAGPNVGGTVEAGGVPPVNGLAGQAVASGLQPMSLGTIFADALKPLAQTPPIDPNALVRKPKHSVGELIGDLGKPVELSELG